MFQVSDVVQMNPHERVHALVRVHIAYLWAKLAFAALFLIIPFFFLFSLLHAGTVGLIVFVLLLLMGAHIATRSFFLWDAHVLVLTDRRLIYVIQKSLWHRIVSEVALGTIRELQWEQSNVIERGLRCGTVRIKTGASSEPDLIIDRIAGPEDLVRIIKDLRDKLAAHATTIAKEQEKDAATTTLDERREKIHAWVSELSVDTLHKVEHLMHEHAHAKK